MTHEDLVRRAEYGDVSYEFIGANPNDGGDHISVGNTSAGMFVQIRSSGNTSFRYLNRQEMQALVVMIANALAKHKETQT